MSLVAGPPAPRPDSDEGVEATFPSIVPSVARSDPGSRRWLVALFVLMLVQGTMAMVWVRPGPLSIDEVVYQWMARSAAGGHPLTISNGYEELPSPELATPMFMWPSKGRLTAQYPLLFPLVALPFYVWAGFRGLFMMNALAFAGVLVFCWRIGFRLMRSHFVALVGCVILAGATYAWEYSMAAWPHMVTLLLQLAAFDLALTAFLAPEHDRRPGRALLAGILLGIAVGFRRDAVFLLPVLGLPLLFASPPRLRSLGALVLGALPPLALLGWLNWMRWGTWSPLSYGRSEPGFHVVGVVGVLGLVALVLLSLPRVREVLFGRPMAAGLLAVGAVGVLLLLPSTGPYLRRAVAGAESLLVDLGSTTGGRGGQTGYEPVVYVGGLKKALLQSLPWIPLLLVAAWTAVRDPERRRATLLLALPAVVYIGIPILLDRHGGMSTNIRYFIPALPFLALLAAIGLEAAWQGAKVTDDRSTRAGDPARRAMPLVTAGVAALLALTAWGTIRPAGAAGPRLAPLALVAAPLGMALVMTLAAVSWIALRGGRAASVALVAATAVALAWSGAMAFDYDARWSRGVRSDNLAHSADIAARIPGHALLFTELTDSYVSVPELRKDVIVAFPGNDGYRDFPKLARYHLATGRRVYAALNASEWETLRAAGALEGLEREAVGERSELVELRHVAW